MKNKSKKILAAIVCLLIVVVVIVVIVFNREEEENYVYKETKVQFGTLVKGVSESGSVDIGTIDQTFDLDMSALQRVDTSDTSSSSGTNNVQMPGGSMGGNSSGGTSSGGGMNMFTQIFGMSAGSNTTGSGEDSSLIVAEVCVSVGQQVAEGDVLYVLEEESVSDLEEELQANVEKAKADLEAVYADQRLSAVTAEYTYETSVAYGEYAETEYAGTIKTLEEKMADAEESMQSAQESLTNYQEQLEAITTSYNDAVTVLNNCKYSLSAADKESNLYEYVYYFELTEEAQTLVDSLEQQKEQLTERVEQAQENLEMTTNSYQSAKRNLAQGLLTAQETLQLRQLAYATAQETYDIALAYLEEDVKSQETIYNETQEKWDEFSSYIKGTSVCAQYNGVITGVELAAGDSISTGTGLVTLYNMDEVTMTVTVDESDMTDIALDSLANISFTAYPDEIFVASVTEISDAATDSSGNITYDVTVTLQGDVSCLFQGMTGEITFVTEQAEEVLYVSRRAITTENGKSYVKIMDENGRIQEKEVTTGFTDGVNVQIIEGLSEGDVVLIESKVSGS